jgi:hypothetical protein
MNNKYVIWHFERSLIYYRLRKNLDTVEDISHVIFHFSRVPSCVIIILQKEQPEITILTQMALEEHTKVDEYIKDHKSSDFDYHITFQQNIINLPG